MREDTIAAQAIGISVLRTRLSAYVLGAFFAGVGGSLYGHYLGSFSPASFYMAYTFSLICMLVIGGMQSLTGAVLGVVLVTLLSEVLRNLERGIDFGAFAVPPLYGAARSCWHDLHPGHDLPPERHHGRSRADASGFSSGRKQNGRRS